MARALPDLVARVRLDSTGVDSALENLVGSFGKANLALAGVAAGLGLIEEDHQAHGTPSARGAGKGRHLPSRIGTGGDRGRG